MGSSFKVIWDPYLGSTSPYRDSVGSRSRGYWSAQEETDAADDVFWTPLLLGMKTRMWDPY